MQVTATVRSHRLARPFAIARGVVEAEEVVEVAVERDGVTGRGEATPVKYLGETAADGAAWLRRHAGELLGGDPFDLEGPWRRMAAAHAPRGAAAALDSALHDWAGRALGAPVWRLLGLPRAAPPTSYTIGLDDLAGTVARVREAAGFAVLKVKAGGPHDLERLRLIRRETAVPLRVDANGGWTLEEAVELLPQLAELGVELIEQPFPAADLGSYRALRERGAPLPVYLDESCLDHRDVPRVAGLADGIVVKVSKTGGIRGAVRALHAAQAHGLETMVGCMVGSELQLAAAAQVAALADRADLDGHLLLAQRPWDGVVLTGGRVLPAARPGLGVLTAEM